ncbi:hypothetical protein chiPu_0020700 [Chiloscyllium punctatum]|uniref:NACHT domain-containing protein n=1 Tax=Chiloscyllium punctatum TaxID=137246 RepID=A0A401RIN7_CHIPU|nr:hypothetical protein [Chiloscyllium punctatum]
MLQTMESKLSSYLKDIQEIHREYLRSQNEKLLVSNIQRNVLKTFSLSDRYTELIVIANVRERRLLEHELWARGRDHEDWQKKLVREELEKIRIHQLLRGCFGKSSLGGTTVVSGVAGIGKTTMVQKIIHDWAIGQMYAQFSFVFHFKFRDLNDISGRTSLKALLLSSYSHFEGLIQHLWEHPENLLFIFDGLDEFKFNIDFSDWKKRSKGEQDCIDPESHCDLVDIVRCLVQGKLLMNCSVLVTSRPHALDSLERADINLWAEILGFFAEERREYFRKFYGNVTLAEDVFQKIQQNDILYTMCYNPAYCWILCSSLVPSFSNLEFENHLPTTITQLFTNHIYNILNNHTREVNNARDVLLKTGKMAFEGVSRNEIVFNQNHFHQYKLKPSKFISGFMMEILEKDYSTTSAVYTFIHLTIQEYLAALSPYLERAPQNVHKLLEEAEHQGDGRFDIFLRFLVGLSTPSTTQQLAHFLGDFQQEVPCQVKVWLTRTVKTQFTNTRTKKDRRKLMNIFHYVFESQDKLMRFTGECRLKINLGCIEESEALRLTPVDCFVLATVLDLCDFIEELDLNYCYIQAEGLQRLSRILHKCKVLRLNINGLTDDCAEVLATAFSTNLSIIELDLQRNRFRSAAPFCQLIKCCTTLQKIS